MGVLKPHLEALLGSKQMSEQMKVQYGDLMRRNEQEMIETDSGILVPKSTLEEV